jgi:hypothetical protein
MYLYNKKVLVLLLTVMGILLIFPSGAFAAQKEGSSIDASDVNSGGRKTTVKQEYSYKEGEKLDIPQAIRQFGDVFSLVSVSDPVESSSLPKSRTHTYRVSGSYTADQLSQVPENVKLTPVYGEGKRQVDRSEVIRNLSDNEVEKLPGGKIYTDTDGRGPGGRASGDLTLAEVRYDVAGRDADGIPNNYTAYLVYRGEETYTNLLYYTGEATYTKTAIEDGVKTFTVVASYESGTTDGGAAEDGTAEGSSMVVPGDGDAAAGNSIGEGADTSSGGNGVSAARGGLFSQLSGALGGLSPIGAATLATVVAAVMTLFALGVYNKKKAKSA